MGLKRALKRAIKRAIKFHYGSFLDLDSCMRFIYKNPCDKVL
jgi:hypothetical protein